LPGMKATSAVSVGIGVLLSLPSAGQTPFAFRGWEGCYRLTNSRTEVVVVPSAGARVVVFALDGKNVLLADPKVDGKVLPSGGSWMPWDGSAPDTVSPTGGSQLEHVWLGAYTVPRAEALRLDCVSRDNAVRGVRMGKQFLLDPERPLLTICRRLTNISDKPARWGFWERTLVPGRAVGFAPTNPDSAFAGGWGLRRKAGGPFLSPPRLPSEARVAVRAISAAEGMLIIRPQGKGTNIGLDSREGWVAARVDDALFTIRFPLFHGREYPWGTSVGTVFYFADNRLELEPVSPYFDLEPGETVSWQIRWTIQQMENAPTGDRALAAAVRGRIARE